jgi:DNA/RNA endonuclease YhcR with UshA esterase domain
MQKEEKVVVVLLSMALGSLAAASWALGGFEADLDEIPVLVVAEGTVSSVQTTTGGHLILRLQTTSMPIFVSREDGAEEVAARVAKGDRVRARGEIAEYQGRREISVKDAADVEVLRW